MQMAKSSPGNRHILPEQHAASGNLKKGLYALAAALFLLLPPLFHFMDSLQFSKNAIKEKAAISKYVPEILGKAGGRREIKDYYIIRYGGIDKKVQLGSRTVTSKEKVSSPEKDAPYKAGGTLEVLYLPEYPQKSVINPGKNILKTVYHSHDSIALLYLLKITSFFLTLLGLRLFFKSLLR